MSSPFGDDFEEDDLDELDEDKPSSEKSPSNPFAAKKRMLMKKTRARARLCLALV